MKGISAINSGSRPSRPFRVLRINSSSRGEASITRTLSDSLIEAFMERAGQVQVVDRDVASIGLPFIDEQWISASYTAQEERSKDQQAKLQLSDQLIKELQDADVIVLGVPVYNFSIPATLKAWIDLVARAGVTFRYTENGPVGLLTGKKAYLVVASGGMPVGSESDFASRYLRHVLSFMGIDDVEVIAAERLNVEYQDNFRQAQQQIHQAASKIPQSNSHAA